MFNIKSFKIKGIFVLTTILLLGCGSPWSGECWNLPLTRKLETNELIGTYKQVETNKFYSIVNIRDQSSSIVLNNDGTFEWVNYQNATYTEDLKGTWAIGESQIFRSSNNDNFGGIEFRVRNENNNTSILNLSVYTENDNYYIYQIIGDPDSCEGKVFIKVSQT